MWQFKGSVSKPNRARRASCSLCDWTADRMTAPELARRHATDNPKHVVTVIETIAVHVYGPTAERSQRLDKLDVRSKGPGF